MEHRVTITYRGALGEERADALLNELLARAPEMGPVLSENTAEPSFSIVLAVDARDMHSALDTAEYVADAALAVRRLPRSPQTAAVELVDAPPAAAAA